ncbi:MAG TPA: ribonuclease HIII [Nitrospiria bacterium]|jgi:ribonuclease HIII|nr:ribonuclease HIII [Nitrospiria bacterium]
MDESGKGDYFGPLVVAGVQVDPELSARLVAWGVKDSKRLTDKRVLELEPRIREACRHAVVAIGPERYNILYEKMRNLNKLLAWAHARTLENLLSETESPRAIADQFGDERFIKNALMEKGRQIVLEQRPRAEEDPAVAAASIVARAEFLKRLKQLSEEHGMDLPKGASDQVRAAAVTLVKRTSAEVLKKVAKWHFRTTQQVLQECSPR